MPEERARAGGRARSLTGEQVVDAALDVLRAEGLDKVSFRTVSARLGVNPMALYTYVATKDDLLAAMFDRVAAMPVALLRDEARSPLDRLADYYVAARRILVEHADLYRMARPLHAAGDWLASAETLYDVYAEAGIEPRRAGEVSHTLLDLAVGSALRASAWDAAFVDEDITALWSAIPETENPQARAAMSGLDRLDREASFRRTVLLLLEAQRAPHAQTKDQP